MTPALLLSTLGFAVEPPPEDSPPQPPAKKALSRDKEPPKEWDRKAIAKAMPYPWDDGPVSILAWQVREDDRPLRVTECLTVKRLVRPNNASERWALGSLYLDRKDNKTWEQGTIWLTPDPRGKAPPAIWGYQCYVERPTPADVRRFLEERGRTFGPEGDWKLVDGGVCGKAWRAALGWDPIDLFARDEDKAKPGK
ncbi:MAG TPA: hypothetical protein VKE74_15940 [Gemmataceae bacterium]|nr:hypothetical protein [Gemmataceae bacterium]